MTWVAVSLVATGVGIAASVGGKVASASQARKQRVAEYKKLLTGKLLEARLNQEEEKAKKEQRDATMITIGSVSLLSIGALIYIKSQNKKQ